jgi:hypothetical protein
MLEDIARFLADTHQMLPPGQDLYQEVFDTGLFFPLQRQAEMREMIREAKRVNPRFIMEIGADKGGGIYHWCKCISGVKTIAASEIRGTPYDTLFERAFPDIDFLWFGSSHPNHLDPAERIDVLFIDGDKSRFTEDFKTYLPNMNPAGVVFMHDIKDRSPMRSAFERCKKMGYRTREIIDVSDSSRALEKQLRGIPSTTPHDAWLRHWGGNSCGVGVILMPLHPGF